MSSARSDHPGSPWGPQVSQIPPRCLPDASQMPLRCLSDASHMSPTYKQLSKTTKTRQQIFKSAFVGDGFERIWRTHLPTFKNHQNRVPKSQQYKVLRMRFSILENVPTLHDILFKLSRGCQRPYRAKSKKSDFLIFVYIYIYIYIYINSRYTAQRLICSPLIPLDASCHSMSWCSPHFMHPATV